MIKREMKTLPVPVHHMNGTGKESLQRELREAADSIQAAQKTLREMTVHSRDFYVRPDFKEAFEAYWDAQANRTLALENMYEELASIYNAIEYNNSEAVFEVQSIETPEED